ncbi:MAG: U32 family peptidase [Clostridia bacterium]|nr:U32 family peptidase [Clostridia bacterium]
MKKELLAPAGDLVGLAAALRFGADAVYMGGPFMQMRAQSVGQTMEDLAEAVRMAHAAGAKLYVTVNCFAFNEELPRIAVYAKELHAIGVDAVIVSDLGAILTIREACPELEVHVSTQANTMNYAAARHYHALGAKRVVLARELSVRDIRTIRENIPEELELEAFVHGAMCMAYSGRCLLSAYMTGRSGNRGACAQSCRWNYRLQEEKRPDEWYEIEENERGTAILSSFDLNAASFLGELEDAGVCSFKIEGRMKSEYYIAGAVNAYRMALDGTASDEQVQRELEAISHRPYCDGFYHGPVHAEPWDGQYISTCRYVGRVEQALPDGRFVAEAKNRFAVGEELELVHPGVPGIPFTVTGIENEAGEAIPLINLPRARVKVAGAPVARAGDLLRKRCGRDG